jgi:RimJ/RimL family protein N-acetyltransferase
MSELIVHGDHDVARFAAQRVPTTFNPDVDVCIHRVVDGEVTGAVLFSDYTGESIVVSVVGLKPRWCSRKFLQVAFDYPFNQLNVKRIFAKINETNLLSLSFTSKNGFKAVGYIPGVFRDNVAMVICKLEREDCRFLPREPLERAEHG